MHTYSRPDADLIQIKSVHCRILADSMHTVRRASQCHSNAAARPRGSASGGGRLPCAMPSRFAREGEAAALEGKAEALEVEAEAREGEAEARKGEAAAREGEAGARESKAAALEGKAASREGEAAALEGQAAAREGQAGAAPPWKAKL